MINSNILIGAAGLILAALTFFLGQKKSSVDDGQKLGEFMGEIRADIRNIKHDIEEIKRDKQNVQDSIDRAIKQHEVQYHNRGQNR